MTAVVLVVLALQAAVLEAGPSGCGDQGDLLAGTEVMTTMIYYMELWRVAQPSYIVVVHNRFESEFWLMR